MAGSVGLVIFDCDGVLVDSERLAVQVESRILTDLGWPLTPDQVVERFLGRSDAHMFAEVERTLGRPVPDFVERYLAELRASFEAGLRPVAGVPEVLRRITRPTCVASSGTHEKLRLTLGLTGLLPHFEGRIHSAADVEHGKPAPDLFLHAASRSGVPPGRCVVVEDSRSGVEAARAAGMRSLGFTGGLTPAGWLEGPGTTLFHEMQCLPDLLDELDDRP